MNGLQAFDELKEVFPELDDIHSTTWWRLRLEIFLKRPLVRIFQ
jgi:hypothetical protein